MFLIGRTARLHVQALKEIGEVCERVAHGDLNARVVHTDPYGDLAPPLRALNHMLDQTDAYIRESGASLNFAAEGKFYRPFLERGLHGDFRRGAGIINRARLAMRDKAGEAAKLAGEIETQRVAMAAQAKAERAKLADEFEAGVTAIVEQVTVSSQEVAADADTMAERLAQAGTQSYSVAEAAQQATQNTQAVAAASEQMAATVTEISRQLREGNMASKAVNDEANRAAAAVQDLVEANQRIDEVVEFIKSVAFQTNLLALNASVEAARAGEAGKGFAVVAQEVRNLAQKTAEAAKSIAEQISAIQQASDRTVTSIGTIRGQAAELNERMVGITEAVSEQASATADISNNIQAAATRTESVTANIESISGAAAESGEMAAGMRETAAAMNGRADELARRVSEFLDFIRRL
ncbi:methyl-accepting chemotaxis protein [Ferrovibrio sp.]|uniref:methyl-accepting chemotaxis protein n=1 Tax=Ferrovibrio sp. TaxID=1917215 RepID=UPI0025BF86B1|nr:methyl-accepting chemotaxis protein [Ferrovibrio sp.]